MVTATSFTTSLSGKKMLAAMLPMIMTMMLMKWLTVSLRCSGSSISSRCLIPAALNWLSIGLLRP